MAFGESHGHSQCLGLFTSPHFSFFLSLSLPLPSFLSLLFSPYFLVSALHPCLLSSTSSHSVLLLCGSSAVLILQLALGQIFIFDSSIVFYFFFGTQVSGFCFPLFFEYQTKEIESLFYIIFICYCLSPLYHFSSSSSFFFTYLKGEELGEGVARSKRDRDQRYREKLAGFVQVLATARVGLGQTQEWECHVRLQQRFQRLSYSVTMCYLP